MKKRFLISESEKKTILDLHVKKGYNLSEQTVSQQNYTVQDIQNALNRPPFNSNLVADNKFGPLTAGAIMKAIDMVKTGQAGVTPQNIDAKDATSLPSAEKPSGLAQSTPTLQTGPPAPSTTQQSSQTTAAAAPATSTQTTTAAAPATSTQTTANTAQQPAQNQATAKSSEKGDDSTSIE